jgi:crotonobetainyl-CoA:carnitine CoA-transferase CaiB-like acyl-CoA transferase
MTGPGPLSGIRVLDLSLYLPGPYAARLLCDLGAEVVKLEPRSGDPISGFMPGAYAFLNRAKRILRVDLKRDAGRELVTELAAECDVVVEGFRPGVAERLGVGFGALARLRPDLIYCSLSGYGQTGPDASHPGHDVGYEAGGGAWAAALAAGGELAVPHVPVGDVGGALFAATTICAHLAGARAAPIHLDVSLQEVVTHVSVARWAAALRDGTEVDVSALAVYAPGMGLFRTRDDRWVALAAVEDKFWAALGPALGLPELAAAPHDTHPARMRDRHALRARLQERVAALTLTELEHALSEADVPLDPIRGPREVTADPHLRERGLFLQTSEGPHVNFPVIQGDRRSFAATTLPDPPARQSDDLRALGISAQREADLTEAGAL